MRRIFSKPLLWRPLFLLLLGILCFYIGYTHADGITTTITSAPVTSVAGKTGAVTLVCSDLTNSSTSCSTDATNATNITSGTLPNARLSAVPNSALANSAVTVGSTSVSLGATASTVSGLTLIAPALGTATGAAFTLTSTGATTSITTNTDGTSTGQGGLVVEDVASSTVVGFFKNYNSGVAATFIGQTLANYVVVGADGTNNNGMLIGTNTNKPIVFGTNNTERARIDGSGNFTAKVSIGFTGILCSATAPTISSGFGSGASITQNNGTCSFRINVGTGAVANTGTIGLPSNTNGWNCFVTDITTPGANRTAQSGAGTATTVPITNYSATTGLATAWSASDVLAVNCEGD